MRYAVGLLAVLSAGTALAQQPALPRADYFPLNAGSKWVYKTGDSDVTVAVAGVERADGEDRVRVDTETPSGTKTAEYFVVRLDGVYRVQVKDEKVAPPVKVLPIPVKVGATWDVNSKLNTQAIKGTFVVKSDRERVTVPAGTFDAILVEGKDFDIAGAKTTIRIWFAKDRGIVQEEFVLQSNEAIRLELYRFEPGEAPPPAPTTPPATATPQTPPAWASPDPCRILPPCTFVPVTTQEFSGCCARSVRCWVRRR